MHGSDTKCNIYKCCKNHTRCIDRRRKLKTFYPVKLNSLSIWPQVESFYLEPSGMLSVQGPVMWLMSTIFLSKYSKEDDSIECVLPHFQWKHCKFFWKRFFFQFCFCSLSRDVSHSEPIQLSLSLVEFLRKLEYTNERKQVT